MRERLRAVLGSRAFYIVFSVIASFTIWLYVAYVENPDVSVTVRGIKVEFLNREAVDDRGLIITKINGETLTLGFTGRRNSVSRLTHSTVSASVDFSDVKTPGVFQLPYTVHYPLDINPASFQVSYRSADFVTVTVDRLAQKEISVKGMFDGSVAEGFQAEPLEVAPGTITVSGPQNALSKVSHALAVVREENVSKTIEEEIRFKLVDKDGNEVPQDLMTFSQNTVRVVVPVRMVKEVPLTVNLIYGAGADEKNTVCSVSPPSVSVSGDPEALAGLNQIVIGTVDLSKILSTASLDFQIVLPNGVINMTGVSVATASVSISGLESVHVVTSDIRLANVPAGCAAETLTQSIDVLVRGRPEDIKALDAAKVHVEADLGELGATTGTYSIPARIVIEGASGVGPVGDYKVAVRMVKG